MMLGHDAAADCLLGKRVLPVKSGCIVYMWWGVSVGGGNQWFIIHQNHIIHP